MALVERVSWEKEEKNLVRGFLNNGFVSVFWELLLPRAPNHDPRRNDDVDSSSEESLASLTGKKFQN